MKKQESFVTQFERLIVKPEGDPDLLIRTSSYKKLQSLGPSTLNYVRSSVSRSDLNYIEVSKVSGM